MNTLVVFDSLYGNTKKVADAVTRSLGKTTVSIPASKVKRSDVASATLLVVGAPTHGGRPSEPVQKFLNSLPDGSLAGMYVACFDTRFDVAAQGIFLKLLMNTIGYAAKKIQTQLVNKGGQTIIEPAGFIVAGKEGPLRKNELKKVNEWASSIKNYTTQH